MMVLVLIILWLFTTGGATLAAVTLTDRRRDWGDLIPYGGLALALLAASLFGYVVARI